MGRLLVSSKIIGAATEARVPDFLFANSPRARSATGAIRLTVDENIAAVRVSGPEFDIASEPVLLSEGRAIVELKFRKKLPVLFEEFMKHFELKPQAASKYRIAGAALGFGTIE